MLVTIGVILLILWLLGFSVHVAGGFIHLLLIIGIILLLAHFLSGRHEGV